MPVLIPPNELSGFAAGVGTDIMNDPCWTTTVANPAAMAGATGLMMGCAVIAQMTFSGRFMVWVTGSITNDTGGDGATVALRYGTGTAPANQGALTGTAIGNPVTMVNPAAVVATVPFCLVGAISGRLGVPYWLDLSLLAVTGGNASIGSLSFSVKEV